MKKPTIKTFQKNIQINNGLQNHRNCYIGKLQNGCLGNK